MTNKEAIKKIEEVVFQFQSSLDEVDVDVACAEAEEDNRQVVEALEMAIKALEQQPCEDAVSRKVALDSLEELDWDTTYERSQVEEMLKSLPPVTPTKTKDRDKGKWILNDIDVYYDLADYKCSKCGGYSLENKGFCPNCGSPMEVEKDDEEREVSK